MENRYCLQVVSCDDCCGGNVYSTEETVCGKWIDGKPIYRKVIMGKLAKDSGNEILFANVSDLKIDRVVNLHGNMSHNNNTVQIVFPISYNQTDGLVAAVNMFYNNNTGSIYYHFLNCNGLYSGSVANVIIEYTKK